MTEHDMKSNEIRRLNIKKYQGNSFYCRENVSKGGALMLCKTSLDCKRVQVIDIRWKN